MIGAKSIQMVKYGKLPVVTSALTEVDDATSTAMSDSAILLTPAEYGAVVTTTKLADLQTGGQDALAAMRVVGINMAESKNKLGTVALEATTNVLYSDGGVDGTAITASDVMTPQLLNKIYNKLSRANVQKIDGFYIAMMHDDCIHDLRDSAAAGSWLDVNKYANPEIALTNEVGIYQGFRILRNNHATITADGGSLTTDLYDNTFFGFNGLGLAESMVPQIVVRDAGDKLGRFTNIGWHGAFQYKIVDTDAVWKMVSASSVGANA